MVNSVVVCFADCLFMGGACLLIVVFVYGGWVVVWFVFGWWGDLVVLGM